MWNHNEDYLTRWYECSPCCWIILSFGFISTDVDIAPYIFQAPVIASEVMDGTLFQKLVNMRYCCGLTIYRPVVNCTNIDLSVNNDWNHKWVYFPIRGFFLPLSFNINSVGCWKEFSKWYLESAVCMKPQKTHISVLNTTESAWFSTP